MDEQKKQEQLEKMVSQVRMVPYLTETHIRLGGEIKVHDGDFVVTEIPLYQPCGSGDHLYVDVEKQNMTTNSAVVKIASALKLSPRDIGVAGQKDSNAITRQIMSVEHVSEAAIESLDIPGIHISNLSRHRNKLKMGHLAGNRFEIKIRNGNIHSLHEVQALLKEIEQQGVPNYYGQQRFGSRGDTWIVGRELVRGEYRSALEVILGGPTPSLEGEAITLARELFDAGDYFAAADAWPRGFGDSAKLCRTFAQTGGNYKKTLFSAGKKALVFYVSAYQSYLFNSVLAKRINDGTLFTLQRGDVAWKHDKGACFEVEDGAKETIRVKNGEISPSGPLYGKKMKWPTGEIGQMERAILETEGVEIEQFSTAGPFKSPGGRRPLRIFVQKCHLESGSDEHGEYVQLCCTLPAGAYATVLLRELCKPDFKIP